MRAMVFTGPGVVEMLDVDPPKPLEGEVVLDVAAAGICGSELHGISSPGFRQPPLLMGHEFSGTTSDGRRVTVNPILSCGRCDRCEAGEDQLCRERGIVGIHCPGGFAEQVSVPTQSLHEIPDGLSLSHAAMIEPVANALHAWRLAGAPEGGRVGVIGAGTIGLVSLLVASRDAAEVVVADLADDRLAVAHRLGATATGPALEGEFDVIIDAVGAPRTHADSVARLRPGGTTVWLGLLSTEAAFDAQELIRSQKRILGSFAYRQRDFADAVALAPELDLDWATEFPLDRGAEIFTELMGGRSDVVKALLCP